jgi:hypothetical protein
VNSPPPKPEVILTNFFAEPTVLLVPITSRDTHEIVVTFHGMLDLVTVHEIKAVESAYVSFRSLFNCARKL